jgi:hypothetical protein
LGKEKGINAITTAFTQTGRAMAFLRKLVLACIAISFWQLSHANRPAGEAGRYVNKIQTLRYICIV